jgi:O-antigen/teichoic acid export membrane protein
MVPARVNTVDYDSDLVSLATRLASSAVRNTALVLSARVVSRLVALVMVIRLATYLGPDAYGRYTSLVAYSALVSVVADLGLSPLYTREAARESNRQAVYLGTLLVGKLPLALMAVALFATALAWSKLGYLLLPGAALLVLTTYSTLLRNTFFARGRLEFEAIVILCETVIQAGLIIVGSKLRADVSFFIWSYAASYGFTTAYCLVVIQLLGLGGIQLGWDRQLLGTWIKLAFPFALGGLLTNLYFKADVPILQHLRPFREVGWYQFAYKPFESLQFVPLAVQSVVYPLLGVYHREAPERLGLAYARFFKVLILLGWPLTVGTFVLVHPIGRLFRLYAESEPSLRILSLAIVFLFANSAFTAMLYAIDRQDLFAWTTGVAVIVNVGLNLLLIATYGYLGASATTVVTEATFSVVGWWFVARRHRLPWMRVSWRILLAGLVMGLALLPLAQRSILLAVPAGLVVYVGALWLLRAIDREELLLLRKGFGSRG